MNNNKVLLKLSVPDIDMSFDVFVPINRKVGNIIELLNKLINEMTKGLYIGSKQQNLYNKYSGIRYNNNLLIIETDIRNGTHLILI